MELKKACAYIRVSTDRQEELSPDAQKRLISDYARKNHITLQNSDVYMDIGISGKLAEKRPNFQAMIGTAKSKEHPYDVILVWKFSRFARNQEESIVYKALLKKNSVEVISISEPLMDGPFGTLIERIIEWMDEYYSIRLSGEVKRGMQEKVLHHGYVSTAPFGYDHEKNKTPSVNLRDSAVVKQIFNQYVYQNHSCHQIALWCNSQGYTTKQGSAFDTRSISYILTNPFYTGKIRFQGSLFDAFHEPIIEESLFQAAATRRNAESSLPKRKPSDTCAHWLSGMLICPVCNGSLGYNRGFCKKTGKSYPVFYCWKSAKGKCHARTSISVSDAETYTLEGLRNVLSSVDSHYRSTLNNNVHTQRKLLEKKMLFLEKKEARAKKAYLDGVDTLTDYKETRQALLTERNNIIEAQTQLSSSSPAPADIPGSVRAVLRILSDDTVEKETKATALRTICQKIEYHKTTEELIFYLIVPNQTSF